jgi:lipopolysaccharide transport system ATP-binding protein
MDHVSIRFDHVSKTYRLGTSVSYLRLSEVLQNGLSRVWRRRGKAAAPAARQLAWALRDASLQVRQGEIVGIIGRNGAGKTTLLKLVARITRPTSGRIGVCGRVGSLLEVGTGFHPELTGRENIFLNGAILGMTRREVRSKLDEVVAFAELGDFLDTPVKRYSSGMYMRLAFAVAAHLEPEILLVDEVLAVGDLAFQRKCLGKMSDVARSGRTILFVSHNMTAVSALCGRALLLEKGEIAAAGPAEQVVAEYLQRSAEPVLQQDFAAWGSRRETDKVRLHAARIALDECRPGGLLDVETPFRIECEFEKRTAGGQTNLSLLLYNLQGVCIFNTISPLSELEPGQYRSVVHIPGRLLNNGLYRVRLLIVHDLAPQVVIDEALVFEVHDTSRTIPWYGEWMGAVRPELPWTVERLSDVVRGQQDHNS